jgi:hypothetical protein
LDERNAVCNNALSQTADGTMSGHSTLFESFPVRMLGRAVFPLEEIADPRASARFGWRAPLFCFIGLEPGAEVDCGFSTIAPLLDVTGAARGTQRLTAATRNGNEARRAPWESLLPLAGFDDEDLPSVRWNLSRAHQPGFGHAAFAAVCCAMDRVTQDQPDSSWQRFLSELERGRYEADVWFERDRANLSLRDTVMDAAVFSLWDEEVSQAIQNGFITAPRRPRPNDADWLPALLDYATSQGLLKSLRAGSPQDRSQQRERVSQ